MDWLKFVFNILWVSAIVLCIMGVNHINGNRYKTVVIDKCEYVTDVMAVSPGLTHKGSCTNSTHKDNNDS